MTRRALICLLALAYLSGGCVEILSALYGVEPRATDGTASPGGDSTEPDGDGDSDGVPVVSLRVSNPFPQMNETVTLTCSLDPGSPTATTFDFQPNDGRLDQGRTAGTAEFTPSESDLGADFTYTCTATNVFGTSARSTPVTISPTR